MSPRPRSVGSRLLPIGALLALTTASLAAEPARIGEIRFLRDGKIDRICFDYSGTLHYKESHQPSSEYGQVDFEPAVHKKTKARMKPDGTTVREISILINDRSRQRVRIVYKLKSWVTPTFHDSGNRMEIRFAPASAVPLPPGPVVPPLEPLSDGAAPTGRATKTASLTEGLDDPIFDDYLKLNAEVAAGVSALPDAPAPQTPSALPTDFAALSPARENSLALARAQGGEGTPPAAEAPKSDASDPLAGLDVLSPKKAFLPEAPELERDKYTGGRGMELVDLTADVFQKEVSVNFKEAELQNAIRLLARSADLNIVMDPRTVTGSLTVELNNVPVGAALQAILRARELEIVREPGGIFRIVPANRVRRTATVEEITVHFPLNWVSAIQVKGILDPVVEGDIAADPLSNSIIITDTPIKMEEIANVIRRIDKPEKQVMLEARLVEMNTRLARDLTTRWQLYRGDNDGVPVKDIVNGIIGPDEKRQTVNGARLSNPWGIPIGGAGGSAPPFTTFLQDAYGNALGVDSLSVDGGQGTWSFGTEWNFFGQDFQLDMFFQALENKDLAKVLVAPRVVTLNNQAAKINVVRRIPYQDTVIGAGGAQSATFNYEDVGVQMEITPNITNNDYVRMRITPKQTILVGVPPPGSRPTIDERMSDTNVIVKDEDTAIVAGLRQQDFVDSTDGVPWMHNIPVIGWLFKDKFYRNNKTDLLAFVTPHIIKEGQLLTEQERFRYDEIDIQWDLPDLNYDDVKVDLSR